MTNGTLASIFIRRLSHLFPGERITASDYTSIITLLLFCSIAFLHPDLGSTGLASLNILFGNPLDLYENCKKISECWSPYSRAVYPPTIYVVYAAWLYPFKLLGLISGPDHLPLYLAYWLKVLTTLVYLSSGIIFYKICLEYQRGAAWAKYATIAWMTTPIALFSQAIISQNDIFHVTLTLAAYLMLLRKRILVASLIFGVAITFKYFPTFVFAPLLLLCEKRPWRIVLLTLLFVAPLLSLNILYGGSAAFVEAVRGNPEAYRVYEASLNIGDLIGWRVYCIFAAFTLLCVAAYFTDLETGNLHGKAAFYWLCGATLPFLFITWLPYWLIAVIPPMVLSTMLSRRADKFLRLDILGMSSYVCAVAMGFQNDSDAAMFRGEIFGLTFNNTYLMARFLRWFGPQSTNVFVSVFWAYLVAQVILKTELVWGAEAKGIAHTFNYGLIRQRFYLGLALFLAPALFSIYMDQIHGELIAQSSAMEDIAGPLRSETRLEQSFVARGDAINRVSLYLSTLGAQSTGTLVVQIIDGSDVAIGEQRTDITDLNENAWREFRFPQVQVKSGTQYRIRLSCLRDAVVNSSGACGVGYGVVWWKSDRDTYPDGMAIVDGMPTDSDFMFRVGFDK
jgi:Glycosyltransferase family 87